MPGTHTWAKNLPSLDRHVREAIALAEDLPDSAEEVLALAYEYSTGDADLDALTEELRNERTRITEAEQHLAKRTAEAAARITGRGLSVRDAATLLQVSPQRISQVAPRRHSPERRSA